MADKKTDKKTNKKTDKKTEEKKIEKAGSEEPKTAEPAALNPTLQKKKERREAKAARKEANRVEEKKSRPNNLILAIMIFGILIGMFAFVAGYNYFSKPASIEKYMEDLGGEEVYSNMQWDEYTTANITAEGNSMTIALTAETDEEAAVKELKDYYGGDKGKEQLEDIAAYFLTSLKPGVRGFGADAKISMTLNGEELNSVDMTYREAKKHMEEQQKEAEEAAEEAEADEAGEEQAATDAAGHVHEDGEEHAEGEK